MSLFGNWLLLCFCCYCCCWNSWSLKSWWLWLHFFGQRILWKPTSPQKQMNIPPLILEKSESVTAAPAALWEALSGDSGSWVDVPKHDDPFPLLLVPAAAPGPLVHFKQSLWKVTFLPIIFWISNSFCEERMATLS